MQQQTTPGGAVACRGRSVLRHRSWTAVITALTLLPACTDSTVTSLNPLDRDPALQASLLQFVSGTGQEAAVGEYLAEPLVVQALDSAGTAVPDVPVRWRFAGGGGGSKGSRSSTHVTTTTDSLGFASVDWQMGPTARVQWVTAEIDSPPTVAGPGDTTSSSSSARRSREFWSRARPGRVAAITLSPPSLSVPVGESGRFEAVPVDVFGNPVEGAAVSWSSSDESVATVSSDGTMRAVGAGDAYAIARIKKVRSIAAISTTGVAANVPPIVAISSPAGATTIMVGDTLHFLGTASDPDGTVARYEWDFGDGAVSSVPDPGARVYASEGVYEVSLTAYDNAGAAASDTRVINVQSQLNVPPTADIVRPSTDTLVSLGTPMEVRGAAEDLDGSIQRHEWTFGDGHGASMEEPGSHTYEAPGTYTVEYHTVDDEGARSPTASLTVTVAGSSGPQPPIPTIDSPTAGTSVLLGQPVTFQGSVHDPDGVLVSHLWDFGDGAGATVEDPGQHTYEDTGTYLVVYRTMDTSGAGASDSATVTVTSPGGTTPQFVFHSDWGSGVGRTAHVLADGDKAKPWTFMLDNSSLLEVVPTSAEGLDFPTANVLKVKADNGGSGLVRAAQPQFRTADGYIPIPGVGQSLFYRYYIRITVPDSYSDDPLTHGTQDADDFGLRNWQHEVKTRTNGTFDLRLSVTNATSSNAWPNSFFAVNLSKNRTYRIEQEIRRVSNAQFTLHARVYDASGALVFDDGDFTNADGSATLAGERLLNFGGGGAAQLGAFRTGLNSLVGTHASGTFPFTFAYIGGVAICRDDWCGPYSGGR